MALAFTCSGLVAPAITEAVTQFDAGFDQNKQIKQILEGRTMDIRVAVLPTVEGESIVMRLLDKSKKAPTLQELGMSDDMRTALEQLIRKPTGALLVTGPTGSGKSTTLYAALTEINRPEINIITVEDPVEYRLSGVNQVQINQKAGLTFATALRSILRSDPDVVMVGEIRDGETAKISIEAALTGHLVLSTLHTNDAPQALTRLGEIIRHRNLVRQTCVTISNSWFAVGPAVVLTVAAV